MDLTVAGYPPNALPMRVVLLSDLHVHGPDMPPARVEKIVWQINGLQPDVVLAAGDFLGANWFGKRYSPADAITPLRAIHARHGVYAVLGNNDYEAGSPQVAAALSRAGIRLLRNEALNVGPLAIAGIDGQLLKNRREWQLRRDKVYAALERRTGVKLVLVHRPDEFNWTPGWVDLVLAGHTHCGQVVLPLIGALETGSDFGDRYRCGLIHSKSHRMIVTAGLGTSRLPLRIGAQPDLWLIEIHGAGGVPVTAGDRRRR